MDQLDRATNKGMNSAAFKRAENDIQAAHNAISSLDDIALRENLLHLVDKAFIDGVHQTMILGCVISIISGILAIWLLPKTIKSME